MGLAGGPTLELLLAHPEPQLALDSQSVATVELYPVHQFCLQPLHYSDGFIAIFRYGDLRIARTGFEELNQPAVLEKPAIVIRRTPTTHFHMLVLQAHGRKSLQRWAVARAAATVGN